MLGLGPEGRFCDKYGEIAYRIQLPLKREAFLWKILKNTDNARNDRGNVDRQRETADHGGKRYQFTVDFMCEL